MPSKILTYTLALLAFGSTACKSVEPHPDILITGHGGAGFDIYRNTTPPNTEASVERALHIEGADAIEIDIQLTTDSVLVLFHDTELDRTTPCSGCISTKTYPELQDCPVLGRIPDLQSSHPIPRLDHIFTKYAPTGTTFFLNLKPEIACPHPDGPAHQRACARALSRSIKAQGLYDQTYIETYDLAFLQLCKTTDPNLRVIFDGEQFASALRIAQDNNFEGLALVNESITKEQVDKARDANKFLVIWGVRIYDSMVKSVNKGPHAIMTDDIRMLRTILKR